MESPEDAVKRKNGKTTAEFDVSPGASETEVPSAFNEWRGCFEARLSEPAEEGRANAELVDELENLFGTNVSIVRGRTSSRKTVEVSLEKEKVLQKLEDSVNS